MSRPKPNLHFRNVSGQWRRSARSAPYAPLKIFSPYITGKQAVRLTEGRDNAEVYTLFEAELFLARASSLTELRALLDAGVRVYELPKLHAKIVWMPGIFVSVGSQNLTSKGMRNKEATASVSHLPWMSQVESALRVWIKERKLITPERVFDMERAIGHMRRDFKKWKEKLATVDQAVRAAEVKRERLRQLANERRRREELVRPARLSHFGQSFRQLRASDEVKAVIRDFDTGRVSLVAQSGYSFVRWSIDGRTVELNRLRRYLCVVPELGCLGWARVSHGAISLIERFRRTKSTKFLGAKCGVAWRAIGHADVGDHNLELTLTAHPALGDPVFRLWVDADDVKLIAAEGVDRKELGRWDVIAAEITRHLTQPFDYSRRLAGAKADDFFHAMIGSDFRVRLARLAEHEILVAEAVNRP